MLYITDITEKGRYSYTVFCIRAIFKNWRYILPSFTTPESIVLSSSIEVILIRRLMIAT